jgi:glycyl-tRNA synthetase beta chain
MPDFLLEIGTEEIPAHMIADGMQILLEIVLGSLKPHGLLPPDYDAYREVKKLSTPRRISVLFPGVIEKQEDSEEQILGPALKIALKDGNPTPAGEAFAKKAGVPFAKLEKITTPKGEYLAAKVIHKGRAAKQILASELPANLKAFYWPKTMYWREHGPERFVRPIRWIVALLGDEVIAMEFAGVSAGKISRGHRILGAETTIKSASEYRESLNDVKVKVDADERRAVIREALDTVTRTIPNARWREDAKLLSTVIDLTEWPSAILGDFDREFLVLPEEVLVTVMRHHQKYFAVEDAYGKLAPHFLAVLNTDGDPDGLIRHGNERVLRARFRDAAFFRNFDQRVQLTARVEMLKQVAFQKDLGSYYAKAERTAVLVQKLAEMLVHSGYRIDSRAAVEAAWLAKVDLTTELVKEFTELQGVIGGRYAEYEHMPQAVANAIYDHYKPLSMEDSVPRTLESAVLSIADKADSIAGMFALGLVPSGSKDPLALRRQGNGIVRTIAELKLPVKIGELMNEARTRYAGTEAEKRFTLDNNFSARTVTVFFRERLEFYLRDVLGLAYDVVNATLAAGADDVIDAVARASAIKEVRTSDDFALLFIAFKRIKNIIKQAREKSVEIREAGVQFEATAVESEIWQQMQGIGQTYLQLFGKKDYAGALKELARLRAPVDLYFDKVMVMVEDSQVRANRLGVLNYLLVTFNKIADLSELVVESK